MEDRLVARLRRMGGGDGACSPCGGISGGIGFSGMDMLQLYRLWASPEKLIVRQTVSRNVKDYRAPVPVFNALRQLENAGKSLRLGQTVRLIHTLGASRAHAWDAGNPLDLRRVNLPRYRRLLDRAVDTVMEPITGGDDFWLTGVKQLTYELPLPG